MTHNLCMRELPLPPELSPLGLPFNANDHTKDDHTEERVMEGKCVYSAIIVSVYLHQMAFVQNMYGHIYKQMRSGLIN